MIAWLTRRVGSSWLVRGIQSWYTFQHLFYDKGDGTLAVDLRVLNADGEQVFLTTRNTASDVIATVVGGPRYQWFTFIDGAIQFDNQRVELFKNHGQRVSALQSSVNANR